MAADRLYLAGRGWVFAIDAHTLAEVWSLELKPGWFKVGSQFTSLREDEAHLFALAYGRVYKIDKATGTLLQTGPEIEALKQQTAVFSGTSMDAAVTDGEAACDTDGDGDGDGGD